MVLAPFTAATDPVENFTSDLKTAISSILLSVALLSEFFLKDLWPFLGSTMLNSIYHLMYD